MALDTVPTAIDPKGLHQIPCHLALGAAQDVTRRDDAAVAENGRHVCLHCSLVVLSVHSTANTGRASSSSRADDREPTHLRS